MQIHQKLARNKYMTVIPQAIKKEGYVATLNNKLETANKIITCNPFRQRQRES